MNDTKHPRFIKELPPASLLLAAVNPLAEVIAETLLFAGIDASQPVYTKTADRVRLLAIDHEHQFPIVGEVIDFSGETTWLARWSASGVYAGGSDFAIARHSLHQNVKRGTIREPECGCVVDFGVDFTAVDIETGPAPTFFDFVKAYRPIIAREFPLKEPETNLDKFRQKVRLLQRGMNSTSERRVTFALGKPIEACWLLVIHPDDEDLARSQPTFHSVNEYGLRRVLDTCEIGMIEGGTRVFVNASVSPGKLEMFGARFDDGPVGVWLQKRLCLDAPTRAVRDGPNGTELHPMPQERGFPKGALHTSRFPPLNLGTPVLNLGTPVAKQTSVTFDPVEQNLTNAVLIDWPLPLGSCCQAESAEVIGRAKRAVAKWCRQHQNNPNLRQLVAPSINLDKAEAAVTDAHLTPAAHLWSLAAFYAMAGVLHLGGAGPEAAPYLTPLDLQRIVDGCKLYRHKDYRYGYYIGVAAKEAFGVEIPAKAAA